MLATPQDRLRRAIFQGNVARIFRENSTPRASVSWGEGGGICPRRSQEQHEADRGSALRRRSTRVGWTLLPTKQTCCWLQSWGAINQFAAMTAPELVRQYAARVAPAKSAKPREWGS